MSDKREKEKYQTGICKNLGSIKGSIIVVREG